MSKPKIYGYCDAGCKWETIHKDELTEAAALIEKSPNFQVTGYKLDPTKWYKVYTTKTNSQYNTAMSLRYEYNLSVQSVSISNPTADTYKDYFYIHLASIVETPDTALSMDIDVKYEFNPYGVNNYSTASGTGTPATCQTDKFLVITGATKVFEVNGDATFVLEQETPALEGSGAPTTLTRGYVGQLYVDTTGSRTVYVCKNALNGFYIWEQTGGGGTSITVIELTGTSGSITSSQLTQLQGNSAIIKWTSSTNDYTFIKRLVNTTEVRYKCTGIGEIVISVSNLSWSILLYSEETTINKTTSLTSSSTNTQYPAAKTVYDFVMANRAIPENISTAAGMDAVLIAANVGKVYRYTGTTTANYTNGDLYEVEEE